MCSADVIVNVCSSKSGMGTYRAFNRVNYASVLTCIALISALVDSNVLQSISKNKKRFGPYKI